MSRIGLTVQWYLCAGREGFGGLDGNKRVVITPEDQTSFRELVQLVRPFHGDMARGAIEFENRLPHSLVPVSGLFAGERLRHAGLTERARHLALARHRHEQLTEDRRLPDPCRAVPFVGRFRQGVRDRPAANKLRPQAGSACDKQGAPIVTDKIDRLPRALAEIDQPACISVHRAVETRGNRRRESGQGRHEHAACVFSERLYEWLPHGRGVWHTMNENTHCFLRAANCLKPSARTSLPQGHPACENGVRDQEEVFMKTAITEMFGIEHPIIQGGMHYVGFAEMAAAVSNAGGLGIITALTQKTPADLANEIARCKDMTDKPFGVNLTFLPSVNPPDYPGYIKAIIEGGVKAVETAGNNPAQVLPILKDNGIKVIHKCTAVRHALKAQSIGCDAVSVDGFECGGHPGEDDVPNMILLPRAADELEIPFVSSGGQADGRSLVASLAMGAQGMNMGTRFIATKEAPVHENVKQAIVAATELDTRLVMRPLRNTERVLNNAGVERLLEKEKRLGSDIKFEDIIEEVAGVYPKIMKEGDMDAGAWSCGMVAGLIYDIPTCKELIDRIMQEAHDIIEDRLRGFLGTKAKANA